MKWALLISGIVEIIGALTLYMTPELIFSLQEGQHIISKFYGLTMLIVGLLNVFAYASFESTPFFKRIFLAMMGFHGALAMMCYSAPSIQFPYHTQATVTHGILFCLFVLGYLKDA